MKLDKNIKKLDNFMVLVQMFLIGRPFICCMHFAVGSEIDFFLNSNLSAFCPH